MNSACLRKDKGVSIVLDLTKLTDQARLLLAAAGWFPERQYDATTNIIKPLEVIGWQIFPEAQRIFATLGMLNLNLHPPPIPSATLSISNLSVLWPNYPSNAHNHSVAISDL